MSGRANFRVTTTHDGRRHFNNNRGGGYSSSVYNPRGNSRIFNKNRGRRGGALSNRLGVAVQHYLDRDESMGDESTGQSTNNNTSPSYRQNSQNLRRGGRGGRNQRYRGRNLPQNISATSLSNVARHGSNDERGDWFKIRIINGKPLEKDFILKSITDMSQTQFKPVLLGTEMSDVVFFVKGYEISRAIQRTSKKINTPTGSQMLIDVERWYSQPPLVMTPEVIEKIKIVMSTRYDAATSSLNLCNMFNDKDLNEEGIFLALNKPHVNKDVFDIIGTHIPQLNGLDLSENRIVNTQCLSTLRDKAPNLLRLNLSNNQIKHERDLDVLKGLPLVEIHLKGNILCRKYETNTQSYTSAIRRIFPKIIKLDEHDLPPPFIIDIEVPSNLPPTKGNHFVNDNIKNLICCFVEQYFACYDNDNRKSLLAAYHEQAKFSLATHYKVPARRRQLFSEYESCCRNIKYCGNAARQNFVKTGPQEIIKLLDNLPATQHDPQSFVVDVSLTTATMLVFVISGIFREKVSNNPPIRQFSRAFITVPNGSGIAIVNDMLTITSASPEQAKKAFSGGSAAAASSSTAGGSAAAIAAGPAITQDIQLQMVKQLMLETTMNEEWAARCLTETGWDYDKALHAFRDVHAKNGVPPEAFVR